MNFAISSYRYSPYKQQHHKACEMAEGLLWAKEVVISDVHDWDQKPTYNTWVLTLGWRMWKINSISNTNNHEESKWAIF